jgi:hydrogenase-4 component F
VSGALPLIVVVLPFVSAAVLASMESWRMGAWINTGSASLQFVAACALAWSAGTAETQLVLLTSLVAMTVSWFGHRDIAALLTARSLNRQRVRLYHVGYQTLIGGIQGAALGIGILLTWLALAVAVAAAAVVTGAARGPAAGVACSRLLVSCGTGLMLALLGTLLPGMTPDLAGFFVLLGYAALAGLVPLHSWIAKAAAEGVAPGATIVTALLPNVPMLLFIRLSIAPWLLMAFGLASLLVGATALHARLDPRRCVAFAGMAQLGIVAFGIGVGAKPAAWLHLMLLALARSAVLQSQCSDMITWLTLALLPLLALYLLAGPTVAVAPWLLAPLAVGMLLAAWGMLERCPVSVAADWVAADWVAATPAWLQVALVVLLAFAMPGPLGGWFPVAAG